MILGYRDGRKRFLGLASFICLILIATPGFSSTGGDNAAKDATTSGVGVTWNKDMRDKLDKTVKVLNVVKEELSEADKKKAADAKNTGPASGGTNDLGAEVKEKTGLAVRVWRKAKQALGANDEKGLKNGSDTTEEADWTENAEENVDSIVRLSEKVHKIVTSDAAAAGETAPGTDISWEESMKKKIDSTIKILDAVKQEIDEKKEKEKGSDNK